MAEATKDEGSYAIEIRAGRWLIIRPRRMETRNRSETERPDRERPVRLLWLTKR